MRLGGGVNGRRDARWGIQNWHSTDICQGASGEQGSLSRVHTEFNTPFTLRQPPPYPTLPSKPKLNTYKLLPHPTSANEKKNKNTYHLPSPCPNQAQPLFPPLPTHAQSARPSAARSPRPRRRPPLSHTSSRTPTARSNSRRARGARPSRRRPRLSPTSRARQQERGPESFTSTRPAGGGNMSGCA